MAFIFIVDNLLATESRVYSITRQYQNNTEKVCTKACQLCRIASDIQFDASMQNVLPCIEHMFALGEQTDVAGRTPTFRRWT